MECTVPFSRTAGFATRKIGLAGGTIDTDPSFLHRCMFCVNVATKTIPGLKVGVALIATDPPSWPRLQRTSSPTVEGTFAGFPLQSTNITEL